MKSDRQAPVAIIGGGFSGTIVAAQLARRGIDSLLVDGSGRLGNGVAYSTREAAHLLNVRAEGMSAWADQPGDFAEKFEARGGDRRGFAQRRMFGAYLAEILEQAVASGRTRALSAMAIDACHTERGWQIRLDDGETLEAKTLILAMGNQEPEPLRVFAEVGHRFIANPWGPKARHAVHELARSSEPALLVGTGLTMVDLVLSLDAAGHQGRIVALSRRGLVPRPHADFTPCPVDLQSVPSGSLKSLWRWLRRRSAQIGWRAAVDSLRPHTQSLWQGLGLEQQQRFLRHARPWWDVHRHRIAPEVASTLARLVAESRLEIIAGRLVSATGHEDRIDVEYKPRGAAEARDQRFAYAFNCTGPLHAIQRTGDPLLASLMRAGAVRPDELGMGIDVDERSRAVGGKHLWALGPLTKGRYWEIVAVPDIRTQAAEVASDIARELNP